MRSERTPIAQNVITLHIRIPQSHLCFVGYRLQYHRRDIPHRPVQFLPRVVRLRIDDNLLRPHTPGLLRRQLQQAFLFELRQSFRARVDLVSSRWRHPLQMLANCLDELVARQGAEHPHRFADLLDFIGGEVTPAQEGDRLGFFHHARFFPETIPLYYYQKPFDLSRG